MSARRFAILLATAAVAAGLSACISVLPKTKPDQLYNFGQRVEAGAPAAAPRVGTAAAGVLLTTVEFPRAAMGDQILTISGVQSAYIAQSRWVGPASVLFREAVERAFDRSAQRSRLIARGETGRAALVLRLDVLDFEALYPNGPGTTPTVAVSVKGRLSGADGRVIEDRTFDVRRPAADNRVGPIVEGFDAAVGEVLSQLVAWTDKTAGALPSDAPGMAAASSPTAAAR